jgi:alpha-1,6-mannosyltransferase
MREMDKVSHVDAGSKVRHENQENPETEREQCETEPKLKRVRPTRSTFPMKVPSLILLLLMLLHIYVAPYTKVEESFNMQAIHDLIYTYKLSDFDHVEFPGVVPRTFVGPILVSSIIQWMPLSKTGMLYAVRITMALGTWSGLVWVATHLERIQKRSGVPFLLFCMVQFHLVFWGSRTLPNVFALVGFLHALGWWMSESKYAFEIMSFLLVWSASIFRSELTPLGGAMIVSKIVLDHRNILSSLIFVGLCAVTCVANTIAIDSFYWGQRIWPEWHVFVFNGVENKSVHWGVHPFHDYFTHLLPKVAPLTFPIAKLSFLYSKARPFALLALLHTMILSFVPHKEWRFVMYCIPLLNAAASITVAKWMKTPVRFLVYLAMLAVFGMHLGMLTISGWNYPGGYALHRLHAHVGTGSCQVHMDVYSSMTGITRFGQLHPNCTYSKTENLSTQEYTRFDFLITHNPEPHQEYFETIDDASGYRGIRLRIPEFVEAAKRGQWSFPIEIRVEPLVYIMRKVEPAEAFR